MPLSFCTTKRKKLVPLPAHFVRNICMQHSHVSIQWTYVLSSFSIDKNYFQTNGIELDEYTKTLKIPKVLLGTCPNVKLEPLEDGELNE